MERCSYSKRELNGLVRHQTFNDSILFLKHGIDGQMVPSQNFNDCLSYFRKLRFVCPKHLHRRLCNVYFNLLNANATKNFSDNLSNFGFGNGRA
jgi:hypothetical protein